METTAFLVSCPYATCAVPEAHRAFFRGKEDIVESPEGWEPGALNLAQGFAMRLHTPLVHGEMTKLLIDLEEDGDARWSRFSKELPETTRGKLVERKGDPYRQMLAQRIEAEAKRRSRVLHLIVHTSAEEDGLLHLESAPGDQQGAAFAEAWAEPLRAAGIPVRTGNYEQTPLRAALTAGAPSEKLLQLVVRPSQTFFLTGTPMRWMQLKKLLTDHFCEIAKR